MTPEMLATVSSCLEALRDVAVKETARYASNLESRVKESKGLKHTDFEKALMNAARVLRGAGNSALRHVSTSSPMDTS